MKGDVKAVLFDLDGTLLDNNMAEMVPFYLRLLSARVAHIIPPKEFAAHLMRATDVMAANDGRATNETVFAEAFYPLTGHPRAELEPIFMDFYLRDFAALRQFTRRRPEARDVVAQAFAQGYDVVIATNPFFPAVAIQQRLAWAGVDDFPYRLVTTYENSHFCKPNLGYFEEIAAYLGHAPEACLVGTMRSSIWWPPGWGVRPFSFRVPRRRWGLTSPSQPTAASWQRSRPCLPFCVREAGWGREPGQRVICTGGSQALSAADPHSCPFRFAGDHDQPAAIERQLTSI